ncbi:MAG: SDR family oxidoreductase [Phascolarctobacterium sp.]|nr:SDR family oxidoreductase [Phascolarctobacterium sp.]
MMNYGCEGLNVVISGGTSGIGLAAAEKFLADGANVYILGRSVLRGAMAVQKLQAMTGEKVFYIPCDVTSAEDCRRVMQSIGESIHVLVNAAGVYLERRLENLTEEDFSYIIDTNLKGTMLLTQAALPLMYEGGSIINIASDAGISGNYGCPLYCASKGAVVALTKALALDYAPRIRVNCVCPADVDTPLLRKQLEDSNGGYTMADMADAYPLQRIGRAEEIAHVICSVASPHNSFMTGSVIPVDGGLTAK